MTNQIPNNWQKVKLGNVTENLDNKRIPVAKEKRQNGKIPYYGATGIVDYVDNYIFDEELLLVGEDGADWSSFANTAYIIRGKSWVNNHAHVLRVTKVNIGFLMEFLNYADLTLHTSGTTRGKLNKSDLMNIQVPLPDRLIQDKIYLLFTSLNNQITKTDQIIQKTEVLKQGLMQNLLTKGIGHKKFKKTKFGDIPSEWELLKIRDICSVRQGLQIAIKDRKTEAGSNRHLYLTNQFLKDPDKPEYIEDPPKNVLCSEDDVLMTRTGNTGLVVTDVKGVFHNNFFLVDYDRSLANKRFLVYFLQSNMIQRMILDRAGSTTIPDLNHGDFYSLPFVCPPMKEQIQIAELIQSVDKKLSVENEQLNELFDLKKGLMQDIFSQKVQIN